MSTLLGLGRVLSGAREVSEVLVENKTKAAEQQHEEFQSALEQLGKEFGRERLGWFDALVDGLNRLPRPALALGTIGLFTFAMADPVAFAIRMQGLALVPDPLWWLLGAIVSFYFSARELHYFRSLDRVRDPKLLGSVISGIRELEALSAPSSPETSPSLYDEEPNAALEDWRKAQ